MNFFAHFYFDRRHDDDAYNLGLILPDLVRIFDKRARIAPVKEALPADGGGKLSLLAGCRRHQEQDTRFHQSEFFRLNEETIKAVLREKGFYTAYHRSWFVAHIFLELMLDRILIKQNKALLEEFYRSLNRIEKVFLSEFLRENGVQDPEGFFDFFDRFRTVQYLFYYPDNEKFIYSLNRICLRAGLQGFSSSHINLLGDSIKTAEPLIFVTLPELKKELLN